MELKIFRNNFIPEGMDKPHRDTVIAAIFNEVTGRDFVTSLIMASYRELYSTQSDRKQSIPKRQAMAS